MRGAGRHHFAGGAATARWRGLRAALSPRCRGAGEGDGTVLAGVRRGAAGAPGHAGDTVPAEPPATVTALRAPGETQRAS